MRFRLFLALSAGAVLFSAACGATQSPGPPPGSTTSGPITGGNAIDNVVPPPEGKVVVYADCLRNHGAQVSEIVGAVIVVESDDRRMADANSVCSDQRNGYISYLDAESAGNKHADARQRFISLVNSRLRWKNVPLFSIQDPVLVKPTDPARTQAFYDVVEELRRLAVPTSTSPPTSTR